MSFPRLVLHAKAFALPGALSRLTPSSNDALQLADMGLARTADGRIVPALTEVPTPQKAA